jgi:membrane protease YdiL (CAAX protease family)
VKKQEAPSRTKVNVAPGVVWGILLTALPFGLMHVIQYGRSCGAVLVVFLVGVVLTTIRAATKSVASSFPAHVGYNGTLMVLTAWATDGFRHMEKAAAVISVLGTRYYFTVTVNNCAPDTT